MKSGRRERPDGRSHAFHVGCTLAGGLPRYPEMAHINVLCSLCCTLLLPPSGPAVSAQALGSFNMSKNEHHRVVHERPSLPYLRRWCGFSAPRHYVSFSRWRRSRWNASARWHIFSLATKRKVLTGVNSLKALTHIWNPAHACTKPEFQCQPQDGGTL